MRHKTLLSEHYVRDFQPESFIKHVKILSHPFFAFIRELVDNSAYMKAVSVMFATRFHLQGDFFLSSVYFR